MQSSGQSIPRIENRLYKGQRGQRRGRICLARAQVRGRWMRRTEAVRSVRGKCAQGRECQTEMCLDPSYESRQTQGLWSGCGPSPSPLRAPATASFCTPLMLAQRASGSSDVGAFSDSCSLVAHPFGGPSTFTKPH